MNVLIALAILAIALKGFAVLVDRYSRRQNDAYKMAVAHWTTYLDKQNKGES